MNKISSKEACRMAIDLIEAQLRILPLSVAALSSPPFETGAAAAQARHIAAGNALLAVGMFFKAHGIAATRTPEVQFLGHVCNAIVHADTFHMEAGHVPDASFGGLTIDSNLDGARLFGDQANPGFMNIDDALALLQRLAQSLRGTRDFVSGGDAG